MKKKSLSIICLVLLFLVFSSSPVSATFFSNFDTDDEGWVIYYGVAGDGSFLLQSPEYCDGFICTDINNGLFMKDDWADWSDYYGGTLEFDIKVTGEGEYKNNIPVFLELPGELGSVAYATNLTVNPDLGIWTHYEIELINSNFYVTEPAGGGDLKERLADITGMLIRADFLTGDDITCIDNVRVNASPVPEPSTVILISTGVLGLAAVKRKTKKRYS